MMKDMMKEIMITGEECNEDERSEEVRQLVRTHTIRKYHEIKHEIEETPAQIATPAPSDTHTASVLEIKLP